MHAFRASLCLCTACAVLGLSGQHAYACSYPGAEYELTQNLFGQCTFAAASDAAIDLTMEVRKGAIAAQYVGRYAVTWPHVGHDWSLPQLQYATGHAVMRCWCRCPAEWLLPAGILFLMVHHEQNAHASERHKFMQVA